MNNWREMSHGEKRFVRRSKSMSRQEMLIIEFRRDGNMAMDNINRSCYQNSGVPVEEQIIIQNYWQIRHDYFGDEGNEKYKEEMREFQNSLPEDLSLCLSTALSIISSNFARHPGRS
jgi:hypothetical protein